MSCEPRGADSTPFGSVSPVKKEFPGKKLVM
jgi:hypothetical protein